MPMRAAGRPVITPIKSASRPDVVVTARVAKTNRAAASAIVTANRRRSRGRRTLTGKGGSSTTGRGKGCEVNASSVPGSCVIGAHRSTRVPADQVGASGWSPWLEFGRIKGAVGWPHKNRVLAKRERAKRVVALLNADVGIWCGSSRQSALTHS